MNRRNPLKNRKGVSMVELIVTFALIALFMGLFSQAFVTSMKAYQDIKSLDYGKQVSDTIMDKITGELSGAQPAAGTGADQMTITKATAGSNYDTIDFYDENGTHVKITAGEPKTYKYVPPTPAGDPAKEEGKSYPEHVVTGGFTPANWDKQFIEHYYTLVSGSGPTAVAMYEAVDWTFDTKMYQGFWIKSLHFTIGNDSASGTGDYPQHVIKVDLELESEKYGLYQTTRYVDCYHLNGATIVQN